LAVKNAKWIFLGKNGQAILASEFELIQGRILNGNSKKDSSLPEFVFCFEFRTVGLLNKCVSA
jgi:hypothetical protein